MGSPIESWEGAEVYFTGADSGFAIWFFLIAAVALTVIPIVSAAKHERESYKKASNGN